MRPRLLNIRLGHACNSSSSHSVLIGGVSPPDQGWQTGAEFGWDYFVLDTREEKLRYLIAQLNRSERGDAKLLAARAALEHKELGLAHNVREVDAEGEPAEPRLSSDVYVDHQSDWGFPTTRCGEQLDLEFLQDLERFLERDDVSILGGNDNDEDPCSWQYLEEDEEGRLRFWMQHYLRDGAECWAEKRGSDWVLFRPETGDKVRISFEIDGQIEPGLRPVRGAELVDMKITDHCPFGCSFCYQSSVAAGAHADDRAVMQYLQECRDMGVFEIAFGGGEPTLHPRFVEIVQFARQLGMVPNVTTKNYQWAESLGETSLGAVAISANTESEVARAITIIKQAPTSAKMILQCVDGLIEPEVLKEAIAQVGSSRVTVLGYKDVGFGPNVEPEHKGAWLGWLDENQEFRWTATGLRIDTALARQYEDELARRKFIPESFHTHEGLTSFYIDACEGVAGPSSYSGEDTFVDIGASVADAFEALRVEG